MNKTFIVFLFFIVFSCGSDSSDDDQQGCENPDYEIVDGLLVGDLRLTNQQEINDFDWNCIIGVTGTLTIGGNQAPTLDEPITDLSSLSRLESIGNLSVSYNELLTSLQGLQNITSFNAQGLIEIRENESLISLEGLNNFPSLVEGISIFANESLTSISAFSNITHSGHVWIDDNDSLINLIGLQNITFVTNIAIKSNAVLINLIGIPSFDAIDSVEESALRRVTIAYNNNLETLEGINGTNLNGKLDIYNNPSLTTISHLNGLTGTDRFDLDRNNSLTSLDGLEDLILVDGPFQIFQNTSLNDFCALNTLVTSGTINGPFSASQCAYNPTLEDLQAGNCSN